MDVEDNSIKDAPKPSGKGKIRFFFGVLRWLAIAVLSGLVIAGLYVQAPWKITALCAVMLAGLTLIYGRLRTFFWLGFAAAAMGVAVWILIPEKDDGQWQRWPLDEEIAAFNARFAIPPEDNAATIYDALLEARDWDEISERLRQADPEDTAQAGLWDDDELPELAELLDELAPELKQLYCAAQIERCVFKIVPSVYDLQGQMSRSSTMRRWSVLLNIRSLQRSNTRQIDDCVVYMRMGQHLYGQPTQLDWLVGLGVRGMGIRRLKEILVNQPLGEEQLDEIERAIKQSKFDIETMWKHILDYEIFFGKDLFALMYQIHPSGKVRFMRVSQMLKGLDVDEVDIMPNTYRMSVLEKWAAVMMWFVMPLKPESIFAKIDAVYEPLYTFPPPKEHILNYPDIEFRWHWNIIGYIADTAKQTRSMLSNFYHDTLARQECLRRGGLLLCELRRYKERHQQWPESLEELLPDMPVERLLDPVSGEQFVYERSEDGFVLYSTGMETWGFDPNDLSRTKERKIIEIWP